MKKNQEERKVKVKEFFYLISKKKALFMSAGCF